jgi:hypothetical protein
VKPYYLKTLLFFSFLTVFLVSGYHMLPKLLNSPHVNAKIILFLEDKIEQATGQKVVIENSHFESLNELHLYNVSIDEQFLCINKLSLSKLLQIPFTKKIILNTLEVDKIPLTNNQNYLKNLTLTSPTQWDFSKKELTFSLHGNYNKDSSLTPFKLKGILSPKEIKTTGNISSTPFSLEADYSCLKDKKLLSITKLQLLQTTSFGTIFFNDDLSFKEANLKTDLSEYLENESYVDTHINNDSISNALNISCKSPKIKTYDFLLENINAKVNLAPSLEGDLSLSFFYKEKDFAFSSLLNMSPEQTIYFSKAFLKQNNSAIAEGSGEASLKESSFKANSFGKIPLEEFSNTFKGILSHKEEINWDPQRGFSGDITLKSNLIESIDLHLTKLNASIPIENSFLGKVTSINCDKFHFNNWNILNPDLKIRKESPSSWIFNLSSLNKNDNISLKGFLEKSEDEICLELSKSSFNISSKPYHLSSEVRMTFSKEKISIPPIIIEGLKDSTHLFSLEKTPGKTNISCQTSSLPIKYFSSWIPFEVGQSALLSGNLNLSISKNDLKGNLKTKIYHFLGGEDTCSLEGSFDNNSSNLICSIISPTKKTLVSNITFDTSEIPLSLDTPLKASLEMDADLSKFSCFYPEKNKSLKGILTGSLEIKGSLKKPDCQGNLDIREGNCHIPFLGIDLQKIEGNISGNGKELEASLQTKENLFNIQSKILLDYDKNFPFEAEGQLKNFPLFQLKNLQTKANGNLQAYGNFKESKLTGSLDMQESLLIIPLSHKTSYSPIEFVFPYAPIPVLQTSTNIKTNVKMNFDDPLTLKGYGVDSQWEGSIALTSPNLSSSPHFQGELSLKKGHFIFCGKTFDLTSGLLSFNGPLKEKSYLNLKGLSNIDSVTVIPCLKGYLNEMALNFTSTPHLPEEDILTRILFDGAEKELTPFQLYRLTQISSQISQGFLKEDPITKLQNSLRLDLLEVLVSKENNNEDPSYDDLGLRFGKYLNDNLFLCFKKGAGLDPNEIAIEAFLSKKWKLRAIIDQNAQTALQVRWQKHY